MPKKFEIFFSTGMQYDQNTMTILYDNSILQYQNI